MATETTEVEQLLAETWWLRRLARSLVRGRDAADDIVQETLLRALATPSGGVRNLRGWLAVVARHVARRFARDGARQRSRLARLDPREPEPAVADAVERTEAQRRVMAALLALDEPYRAVLLLRFQGELGYAAIAQRLGVPIETVRTQIKRGLQRLREQLDERHGRAAWAAPLLLRAPAAAVWLAGAAAVLVAGGFAVTLATSEASAPETAMANAAAEHRPAVSMPLAAVAELPRVPVPLIDASPIGDVPVATTRSASSPSIGPRTTPARGVVRGRVVDAVTGLPIAGAELTQELRFVRFTPEAGSASPPPPPRAYSDAAGEFELPWDEPNATSLLLAVVAAGHDRSALFPSERADRGAAPNHMALDLGDVAVMPETTLAGRVLDVASQPVALAHILLVHERGIAEHVAITDNHGAFAVLGIPRLVGSDPWLVAQAGDTLAFARLPVATQVELRCLPTASMCVRVVDETGAAIAGARVVAQAMCLPTDDGRVRVVDGPWPRHHRHATSDRDGVALLAPLPIATKDGQCLLSACADGHRGERRAQALTSGGNAVVVVLPHGMTAVVRGVVVDAATQRPVAGATVGPCRTGADGTFAIADLDVEGGVVRLAASATGYADTHCEEPVGGRVDPQFVRIDLKPATAASEAPPGPTISVPLTGDVQLPEILAPTPRRAPK